MTNRGGFGQPGPRTYEQKGWQAEILKPLYLAFGFGILLNLLWCAITALKWLDSDHIWMAKYVEAPGVWFKVIVIEWIIAGVYLFLKWTETFWDDDYTTLTGQHPMLGILPMRPVVRAFLFFWWIRQKPKVQKKKSAQFELSARLEGGDDG